MDTCKKCAQKFNYWQVYKNYWSAKQQIQCLNCTTTHAPKFLNKVLLAPVIFIAGISHIAIPTPYLPNIFFFILTNMTLFIIVGFTLSLLTNFFFKFKLIDFKKAHTK
jgi:CXXC-20-CXXC protein